MHARTDRYNTPPAYTTRPLLVRLYRLLFIEHGADRKRDTRHPVVVEHARQLWERTWRANAPQLIGLPDVKARSAARLNCPGRRAPVLPTAPNAGAGGTAAILSNLRVPWSHADIAGPVVSFRQSSLTTRGNLFGAHEETNVL